MGRGILNMELISKEKSRMTTYKKRKSGLMKKAKEFAILCEVDTCMIIFGPKKKDGSMELETYPEEHSDIMNTINKFKGNESDVSRRKTVSNFFESRKKGIDSEIYKLRKANREARFPSWDDRFNDLSLEELSFLDKTFDNKIQAANRTLMLMKGDHFMTEDSKSGISLCGSNTQFNHNITNNVNAIYNQQLISSSMKPFDTHLPAYSLQMFPFDPLMMMMMTNGDDYTQYGGGMSRSNIPYTQLKPAYHDPAMPENVVYNQRLLPMCNYGLTTQPTAPYGQQLMPNVSPCVNASQLMGSFQNERGRFQI